MRRVFAAALMFAASLLMANEASATPLYATDYNSLVSAIDQANNSPGSVIYLAPGTYTGGALPLITASMTLQSDPSMTGDVILDTTPSNQKGILTVPDTVTNVNLTVQGLIFENAAISSGAGGNAAGIRDQSQGNATLTVSDSTFRNNQNGILTGHGGSNAELLSVLISNSQFINNGAPGGFEHGIYIFGSSLNVSNSMFCGTVDGHDIKSRAATTTVTGSTLYDGAANPNNAACNVGSTSYAVDLPNGGQATLTGDTFVQGPATQNSAIVSYGEEGNLFSTNNFVVSNDSFSNSRSSGIAIQEPGNCPAPVQLSNTTFSTTPGTSLTPVDPPTCIASVVAVDEPASGWIFLAALGGLALLFGRRRAPRRLAVACG